MSQLIHMARAASWSQGQALIRPAVLLAHAGYLGCWEGSGGKPLGLELLACLLCPWTTSSKETELPQASGSSSVKWT